MKHVVSTLALALIAIPPPAFADPGTAKKVGGITLITLGSIVGGSLMAMGAFIGLDSCGACKTQNQIAGTLLLGGGGMIGGSIVGGISLIREGRAEQRAALGLGVIRVPSPTWASSDQASSPMPALKLRMDF